MTKKPDYILLGTIIVLVLLGILILASVSAAFSQEKTGSPYAFLLHQLGYGFIPGVILGFIAFKKSLSFFKKWAFILVLINIFLLVLVFVPKIGMNLGGAHRWLNLRIITLQPSEFLKLTFILYLSAWLSAKIKTNKTVCSKKEKTKFDKATFFPFLVVIGVISFLLLLQPDMSTLGIIILASISLYFIALTPLWQTILIIFGGITAIIPLIKFAPYRLSRLLVFLKPETEPMGIGYQINQALIAIGSGGIVGVGLGLSRQKFGFLPQSIGDSIFAIFAEETGFLGAMILIFLFLIFAWRGFKIVKSTPDTFPKFLAAGVTFWIVSQAFINIGSMVGIMPLSGIPLPFVSYGGTALVNELVAMGILLNISRSG